MKFLPFVAITVTTALMACQSHNYSSAVERNPTYNITPLQIISQESQRALTAQQHLLKYRQAQTESLDYRQRRFDTDRILLDYIGKPSNVLSSIAIKYGYRFVQVGQPHDLPTVNFTRVHGTPEDIIINLNAQLGQSASISIDKGQKVISLVY